MTSNVPTKSDKVARLSSDDGEVTFRRVYPPGDEADSLDGYSSSSISVSTLPACRRCLHHLRRLSVPLALGQLLSALISVTAIASTYLVNFGVSLPLAQNLPHYFLLALVYGVFGWSKLLHPPENTLTRSQNLLLFLRTRSWQYFIAGTIDMHSNWAMVSAYNYTNVTSIQLLDCLTIPTAMILSRLCLKTRYRWVHVVGVITCLAGAAAMVIADYLTAKNMDANANETSAQASSQIHTVLLGDFLVIAGAVGYGASNVYQEYLVRKFGIIDYLSFSTLAATLWSAIYCAGLEYGVITELLHQPKKPMLGATLGCLAGFAVAMFLLYTILPIALSKTSSVLVNLSLLTADLYALLLGIYLFGKVFHPLYPVSFGIIMVGVCLFSSRDPISPEVIRNPKVGDNA